MSRSLQQAARDVLDGNGKETRASLVVGDWVKITVWDHAASRYAEGHTKVTRVMKSQIEVREGRFQKIGGRNVGITRSNADAGSRIDVLSQEDARALLARYDAAKGGG